MNLRYTIFVELQELKEARFTNLIGKSLRWVVNDHRLGEISAKDVKVFDVVALDAHAVLTKQSMPGIKETSRAYKSWT